MRESAALAAQARETTSGCVPGHTCARPSPLDELVAASRAAAAAGAPAHRLVLMPRGEDSLALRLHLLRGARRSIDLQTFILSDDDSGLAVIDELVAAARRGVQVRILADQLFSIDNTALLARLARVHANLAMRLYNPTFGKARTGKLEFAAGIVCCFSNFNQRMHNKLLLVDGELAVIGGRNVDDRYFDWGADFIYRDRDVLVVGPVAAAMADSFEEFWVHPRSVAVERLGDVAQQIVAEARGAKAPAPEHVADPQRLARVLARADDPDWVRREFVLPAFAVERVEYFADRPDKRFERDASNRDLSARIAALLAEARERIVLQTPYLVLSREARKLLKAKREANPGLELVVSTNSLAATDAFYVYAVSQKYKRQFVRDLRMQIYEYRPFPGEAEATAARPRRRRGDARHARPQVEAQAQSQGTGAAGASRHAPRHARQEHRHRPPHRADRLAQLRSALGRPQHRERPDRLGSGLRPRARSRHRARPHAGQCLGDRAARAGAGRDRGQQRDRHGLGGTALLRPVAVPLRDQLAAQARAGTGRALRPGLRRALRAGRRLPRGRGLDEAPLHPDPDRLRAGAGADPVTGRTGPGMWWMGSVPARQPGVHGPVAAVLPWR